MEVSHKSTPLASNLPVLYCKRGCSCCLAITCLIKANRSNKQQDAVKLCILPWGLKHCFCEWCMGTKHCDWIVELKFNKEMIITVYMNNCIVSRIPYKFCNGPTLILTEMLMWNKQYHVKYYDFPDQSQLFCIFACSGHRCKLCEAPKRTKSSLDLSDCELSREPLIWAVCILCKLWPE